MNNDASVHGYRWSDGTTRQHPEPKPEPRLAKALDTIANLEDTPTFRAPTQDQYAKAYADWVRNYNEWVREFTAWQQKHGSQK